MSTAIDTKNEFEIPEDLKEIYREMEISPLRLLKNHALSLVYSKMHKYEAENSCFEKKYSCTFQEFKNKINKTENEENFEQDDDLMDWEFASINMAYWQNKVKELTGK